MTSSYHKNDLVPSQEKLEWVTPKISLMEAEDTRAKDNKYLVEKNEFVGPSWPILPDIPLHLQKLVIAKGL